MNTSRQVILAVLLAGPLFLLHGQPLFGPGFIIADNDVDQGWACDFADYNGDGFPDAVYSEQNANELHIQKRSASGVDTSFNLPGSSNNARRVRWEDVDGDGDMDVVAANYTNDRLAWYENQGGDTFSERKDLSTGHNGMIDFVVFDADNDGDKDIVGCSLLDDRVFLLQRASADSFSSSVVLSNTQNGPRDLEVTDINGDGLLDIVVSSRYDNELAWYANQGGGVFGAAQLISNGLSSVFASTALDADNDGDMDLAAIGNSSGTIQLFTNDGSGGFDPGLTVLSGTAGIHDIEAADLDDDGFTDLIYTSSSGGFGAGNRLAWLPNVNGTAFAGDKLLATLNEGKTVTVSDIDIDGDLDVVSSASNRFIAVPNSLVGFCQAPTMLTSTPATTSAVLTWHKESNTVGFLIQGAELGVGVNRNGLSVDSVKSLAGLTPGSTYVWRVKAKCVNGTISAFSEPDTFSTAVLRKWIAEPVLARSGESRFQLSGLPTGSQVRVVDMAGRLVHSFQSTASVEALDASAWASGLYLVEWRSPEGENGTFKLVRE